jgi:hypothetical protein
MSDSSTSDAPSLRALQEAFWGLLRAPSGVAHALESGSSHAWLAQHVVTDLHASAVARLALYADMYFFRLRDNLALDFPRLHAVLGEVQFHNLVTAYLWAHPSSEPSVRHVGQHLPAFLGEHALSCERPWLRDLAALEWARIDVYDRADHVSLSVVDLQRESAQGCITLWLRWVDAHQLLRVSHAVQTLWRALAQETPYCAPEPGSQALMVWRASDLTVHHRALEAVELQLAPRLAEGVSFIDLCQLLTTERSDEHAAQLAVQLVSSWTRAGLLQGPRHAD